MSQRPRSGTSFSSTTSHSVEDQRPALYRAASSQSSIGSVKRDRSPRRSPTETAVLEEATKSAVRAHARTLQHDLREIAESIELAKADHDRLEKQNAALQDYIGGLTRTLSRTSTGDASSKKGKKK